MVFEKMDRMGTHRDGKLVSNIQDWFHKMRANIAPPTISRSACR